MGRSVSTMSRRLSAERLWGAPLPLPPTVPDFSHSTELSQYHPGSTSPSINASQFVDADPGTICAPEGVPAFAALWAAAADADLVASGPLCSVAVPASDHS